MAEDITAGMQALKGAFDSLRSVTGLLRDVKELLPDDHRTATIAAQLQQAEKATAIAEAQIADALNYPLCRCTFPPQIMVGQGYAVVNYKEVEQFKCPNCGKHYPPKRKPPPKQPPPGRGLRNW